jgi:hypothetical protein
MDVPKMDGRKAWLDESQVHAGNFLTKMMQVETQRKLSNAETHLKHISASFIYLYDRAMQAGLLDDPDELLEFLDETIH